MDFTQNDDVQRESSINAFFRKLSNVNIFEFDIIIIIYFFFVEHLWIGCTGTPIKFNYKYSL